ncbi:hypothetical protein [Maribellus maritimus]|uniref:hypothetical protein n=1 Tax=Maribellus maritimus TaxID=2870838 RepID=UPI001EE9F396|nr:hypothetical protein [Maribellus maritimus]MCG6188029.1 hypothetical protein [Maribellus maritimus]
MRKNLSQQKLLEILIVEIEILQQNSKNIKEVAPEIARQLYELKTAKIKFDLNTDKLEELLEDNHRKLRKSVVMPKWFLWLIAGVLLASVANWFV